LHAVGICETTGELLTIPSTVWRRRFDRPEAPHPRNQIDSDMGEGSPASKLDPVSEAIAGRTIPLTVSPSEGYGGWCLAVIAHDDLAVWAGQDPPRGPSERPKDRHVAPDRLTADAINEQLYWFLVGYAVRGLEGGRPPTRDEARAAASRENIADMRRVEKVHATLPDRLKNPNRSKGGIRA
jgi:hypothetical protein